MSQAGEQQAQSRRRGSLGRALVPEFAITAAHGFPGKPAPPIAGAWAGAFRPVDSPSSSFAEASEA
ncbi:hypothetical protein H7347_06225 [Corynebacterium sp. zg-331]|uniref:hypothetical protein n=1 Tax=unclassified Corynebacterium TaxID=2624378 RepID=UPI00128B9416|nr:MULTISPECIES: hypothetical protein [unclassified Corynebacterium]MBC3186171.1 hypothetical protein [Corynebacterium sp. zg-331]MPV52660.1 hypothetical protein [Corynebacterium sp. zg331]